MQINLQSKQAKSSHIKYHLKYQIIVSFVVIVLFYAVCLFIIPMILGSGKRHRPHSYDGDSPGVLFMGWMVTHQPLVLMIGLALAIIANLHMAARRKKMIVALEIDADRYRLQSRGVKVSSLTECHGETANLTVKKSSFKPSPIDGDYLCFYFYDGNKFLGMLVPEHDIWKQTPKKLMTENIKKFTSLQRA